MGTAAVLISAVATLVTAIGGLFAAPKVARKMEQRRQRKQAPVPEVCTEVVKPVVTSTPPKVVK